MYKKIKQKVFLAITMALFTPIIMIIYIYKHFYSIDIIFTINFSYLFGLFCYIGILWNELKLLSKDKIFVYILGISLLQGFSKVFMLDGFFYVSAYSALLIFYTNTGKNIIEHYRKKAIEQGEPLSKIEQYHQNQARKQLELQEDAKKKARFADFDSDYRQKPTMRENFALVMIFLLPACFFGIQYLQNSTVSPSDLEENRDISISPSSGQRYTTEDELFSFDIPVGFERQENSESHFEDENTMLGIRFIRILGNEKETYEQVFSDYATSHDLSLATHYLNRTPIQIGDVLGSYGDFAFPYGKKHWMIRVFTLPTEDVMIAFNCLSDDERVASKRMDQLTATLIYHKQ